MTATDIPKFNKISTIPPGRLKQLVPSSFEGAARLIRNNQFVEGASFKGAARSSRNKRKRSKSRKKSRSPNRKKSKTERKSSLKKEVKDILEFLGFWRWLKSREEDGRTVLRKLQEESLDLAPRRLGCEQVRFWAD